MISVCADTLTWRKVAVIEEDVCWYSFLRLGFSDELHITGRERGWWGKVVEKVVCPLCAFFIRWFGCGCGRDWLRPLGGFAQAQLEKEGKEDQALYDKLSCWSAGQVAASSR